jgi:IS5 family transposase
MNKVIPWNDFVNEILPYYPKTETGRPRMELIMMLKIYFIQQWFNLSDPAMEDAIYDRISFQKFLDIDIMVDKIPDETTILNFRHLLEKYELQKKFFNIVTRLFEKN